MRTLTIVLASCLLLATAAFRWAPPTAKLPARLAVNSYGAPGMGGNIETFRFTAKGDVAPETLLSGSLTGIGGPDSAAIDSSGDIVAMYNEGEFGGESIAVFAAGASGNVAPTRVITDAIKNHRIYYVGIDDLGYVYGFFEIGDRAFGIDVFSPGASGKTTPKRTIKGPATYISGVMYPTQFYVGAKGDLWCLASGYVGPARVIEWAPGAKGDASPTGVLNIQSNDNATFAVNENGVLYLSQNAGSSWVTQVYTDIRSSTTPAATYTLDCGSSCTAAAATGTQVVFRTKSGVSPPAIFTYDLAGPSGELHPLRTIAGKKTGLGDPRGAAVR